MADGRVDGERFGDAVAALDADVLALQEVDRDQPRSGGLDLTAIAAEAMGAPHQVFAPTLYGTPGESWVVAGDRPRGEFGEVVVASAPSSKVSDHRPLVVQLTGR